MSLLRVVLKVRGVDLVPPPPSNVLAVWSPLTAPLALAPEAEDSGDESTVPVQIVAARETA